MRKILSTLVIAGIFISGCAHKGVVKETGQIQPQKQIATEQKQTDDKQADNRASQETVASKDVSKTPSVDSLGLIREMQKRIKDIHFDFDKYTIRNDAKPILKEVAEILRQNSSLKVTIEGNCDEKGTAEYNLALGDRRAAAASEYLSALGVRSGRIDAISNGKEQPLCTENNDACWAKNRRDHFVLGEGKH